MNHDRREPSEASDAGSPPEQSVREADRDSELRLQDDGHSQRPDPGVYRLSLPVDESAPPRPRTAARARHPLGKLLLGQLPLETETTLFILINLLDFFLTYWLLMAGGRGNMRFVEANPVARYFIESWGPVKGMLGFKLVIVTVVCVIAQLIALKREDLGRKVLVFGIVATGAVVAYSLVLLLRHG